MCKEENTKKNLITSTLNYLKDGACEADRLFDLWAGGYRKRKSMLCDRSYQNERNRLRYLKEKELIRIKKKEKRVIVELTERGLSEQKQREISTRSKLPISQVCIVTYDIPTTSNKGRDAFRYFLKQLGFKKRNQSVWESEKDVVAEIMDFVKRTKLEDWVCVYIGTKL